MVPIDQEKGTLQDAYNIRIDELNVLDMAFLTGCARPTVGMITMDFEKRYFRAHEVNVQSKDKVRNPGAALCWFACVFSPFC